MALPADRVVFAQRPPTEAEFARFRLLFSTYQDGTGMLAVKNSRMTLPGWRDFERAVALAFGGVASENKDVMDVRLPNPAQADAFYGISCKMRRELKRVRRDGRVTIELSNAARAFWDRLGDVGITVENYQTRAREVGSVLINLVREWHASTNTASGGDIDLARSYYLTLMWSADGEYQLHQFPIELPNPDQIHWHCPMIKSRGVFKLSDAIRGDDGTGTIFEWYGQSGGQLKYYPKVSDAVWRSDVFRLEPLPPDTRHGLIAKAEAYFPNLWLG